MGVLYGVVIGMILMLVGGWCLVDQAPRRLLDLPKYPKAVAWLVVFVVGLIIGVLSILCLL